jgi:predicted HTH domain antitoxin
MSVTLEMPDDFVQKLQTERDQAEAELHLELAIALYRQGQLPSGVAAGLANMSRWEFEEVLKRWEISMPYSLADLEHDAAYARGDR